MAHPQGAPNAGSLIDRWEERGFTVACALVVLGSTVAAVFDVPPAWLMPFLFAAVYAILRLLLPLKGTQGEIADLRSELALLRREFSSAAFSRVEHYRDAAEFYRAATDYLRKHNPSHLDTWYMRIGTPDSFSESTPAFAAYFRAVLLWAEQGGSVRRLFCSGPSPEYARWTARHRQDTRDLSRYHIREVSWPIEADLMSMAIMGDAVFLAFTTDDRVAGMRIEGSEAAAYFRSYFDRHWAKGADVPR
ncbi:hypothetical protein J2S46_007205 [Kitasatospora herbaricolor]|uniref:hypothetical protein n=1 Tax=Kitasatospora herbaricolor TaxID=68217 RepID=UPI00174BF273|nr:hypothetical protein [Kitasatospora herbaricolor]MDQ0312649.1 hypothetical protein [Kitasatospora herbaricolor]